MLQSHQIRSHFAGGGQTQICKNNKIKYVQDNQIEKRSIKGIYKRKKIELSKKVKINI